MNNKEDIVITDPRFVRLLEWVEKLNPLIRALLLNTVFFAGIGVLGALYYLMYKVGGWPLVGAMGAFSIGYIIFLQREL